MPLSPLLRAAIERRDAEQGFDLRRLEIFDTRRRKYLDAMTKGLARCLGCNRKIREARKAHGWCRKCDPRRLNPPATEKR